MYFLFLTIMNYKYIIITSKRDTQSQRSLKIVMKKALMNRAWLLDFIKWSFSSGVHDQINCVNTIFSVNVTFSISNNFIVGRF